MTGRILVVEDNLDNMKLVTWALEDAGFDFMEAGTAEIGLELLERFSFDVVLMDISLPGMDGTEATRQLRADPRFAKLPIVALTAHAVKGEGERILESGVSELLTKPIDEDLLIRTIESWIEKGTVRAVNSQGDSA